MAPLLRLLWWSAALMAAGNSVPINSQTRLDTDFGLGVQNTTYDIDHTVCVVDDVLYRAGDTVATANACERCVCSPPEFVCSPLACPFRAGCKAVQSPGECCPQYNCECELDGRLYQNGEKVLTADRPCHVCYCRGGHIVCAPLECYRRSDCTPRLEPGSCCPKYDHCPPLENVLRKRLHHQSSPPPSLEPDNHLHRTLILEDDQQLDSTNTDERVVRLGETPISLSGPSVLESEEVPQSDEAVRPEKGADTEKGETALPDENLKKKFNSNSTNTYIEPEQNTSQSTIGTTLTPVLKKVVVLTLNDFYNKDMEEMQNKISNSKKEETDLEVNTIESTTSEEITTPYSIAMLDNSAESTSIPINIVFDELNFTNLSSSNSDEVSNVSEGSGDNSTEENEITGVTESAIAHEGGTVEGIEDEESYSTVSKESEETGPVTQISQIKIFIPNTTNSNELFKSSTTVNNETNLMPEENVTLSKEADSEENIMSTESSNYLLTNSEATTEHTTNALETENIIPEKNVENIEDSNIDFQTAGTTTEGKSDSESTTELKITSNEYIPSNIHVRIISNSEEKEDTEVNEFSTVSQEGITTENAVTEKITLVNNSNTTAHIGKGSELFLSSVSEEQEEEEEESGGEWKDLTTDNIIYLYDKTDSYPTTIDAFAVNKTSTSEEENSKETVDNSDLGGLTTKSLPEMTTQITLVEDNFQENNTNASKENLLDEKQIDKEVLLNMKAKVGNNTASSEEKNSDSINVTRTSNDNEEELLITEIKRNYKAEAVTENNQERSTIIDESYITSYTTEVEETTSELNILDAKDEENTSNVSMDKNEPVITLHMTTEEEIMEQTSVPIVYDTSLDSSTEYSNVNLSETTSNPLISNTNNSLNVERTSSNSKFELSQSNEEKPSEINESDVFVREEPPVLLFKNDMALHQMDVVVVGDDMDTVSLKNKGTDKSTRSEPGSVHSSHIHKSEKPTNELLINSKQNGSSVLINSMNKTENPEPSESSKLSEKDDLEGYINDTPLNKEVEIITKDGKVQEVTNVQDASLYKPVNKNQPESSMFVPTNPDVEIIGTTIFPTTEAEHSDHEEITESTNVNLEQSTSLSPNTSDDLSTEASTLASEDQTNNMNLNIKEVGTQEKERDNIKILSDVIPFRNNFTLDKNITKHDTESRLEFETTEVPAIPEGWLKEVNVSNTTNAKDVGENTNSESTKYSEEEITTSQITQDSTEAIAEKIVLEKIENIDISHNQTNSTFSTNEAQTSETNFTTEPVQTADTAAERNLRSNLESESDDAVENSDLLILQDFFRKLYRNQVSENVGNH